MSLLLPLSDEKNVIDHVREQAIKALKDKSYFLASCLCARALKLGRKQRNYVEERDSQGFIQCWNLIIRHVPRLPAPSPYRDVFKWIGTAEHCQFRHLSNCGQLCAILLNSCLTDDPSTTGSGSSGSRKNDASLAFVVCETLYVIDNDKQRQKVSQDFIRYGGFATLCRFIIEGPPSREYKRADRHGMWCDEMLRAMSCLFLTGAKALRAVSQLSDPALFAKVLRRALELYACRSQLPVTREGAGLLLQNLVICGPDAKLVAETALGLTATRTHTTLVEAALYWMCPDDVKLCDAQTTLQAAQITCNYAPFAAMKLTNQGVFPQVFKVITRSTDNPVLLEVLLRLIIQLVLTEPLLVRLLVLSGAPGNRNTDPSHEKNSGDIPLFFSCPPTPKSLRVTLSRRPLVWILALSHFDKHRGIVQAAMVILNEVMRRPELMQEVETEMFCVSQEVKQQEAEHFASLSGSTLHSEPIASSHLMGGQLRALGVSPELERDILLVARTCGWTNPDLAHCPMEVLTTPAEKCISHSQGVSYFSTPWLHSQHCGNPTCKETDAAVKLNSCGRCGQVRYCSVSCQRSHWLAHKGRCVAP